MGFWDTLLGGSQSTSTSTPIVGSGTQNQFFQGIFGSGLGQNGEGYSYLQGLPGYGGPLSPGTNQNLQGAWGGWSPTNQGTDYMSQMLGGGAYNPNQGPFASAQNNMLQYGGIGGYPTQLMSGMAQYGGTGGPGNYGMSNLMQFGAAGEAGRPLASMAQSGTAGTWGNPLQSTASGGGTANQYLSPFASPAGAQGLQSIIAGGGNPINQLPAWQSMIGAQQRNIGEGQAALNEQLNASGNRFSTAFGTAAADYQNQAIANQNAMLGQMVAGAGENAQNRLLNASSTLGGFGLQGAGQQSAQAYGAGNILAQLGAGATGQLSNNSILGTQGLFGGENQGALSMYNAQNSSLPAFMNYNLGMQGLGQSGAQGLNSMLMGNLGVGAGLGQQQYSNDQSGINNQYANWWQSLPQNNPLLQYMYGAATGYTGNQTSSQQGGLLPGLATIGGALIGKLSDFRLKEDITQVGKAGELNLYTYRYKGLPGKQLGFIAQEVAELYPDAVIPGNDFEPWMIKPGVLLEALARSAS